MVGFLNPLDAPHTTAVRPTHVNTAVAERRWFTDDDVGTIPHAQDFNSILALFRNAGDHYGLADDEGNDDLLWQVVDTAVVAAIGDPAFVANTNAALAVRLRFDAAQSLTAGQKTQAQANMGLGALAVLSTVGTTQLAANAVTNAKMATMVAGTVKANVTGGPFTPGDVTLAVFKAALSIGIADVSGAAPLASPDFTGAPTAPTASAGTNTTQIATTAFTRGEIAALVASSPAALDTLNELAAALGNDPNFATTVTNSLATKLALAGGTMTGDLIVASATLAPAATTDLGGAAANWITISGGGAVTVTSFGVGTQNQIKIVRSSQATPFTIHHDPTAIVLPGSADIVVQNGDSFIARRSVTSGQWFVLAYQKADGRAVVPATMTSIGVSAFMQTMLDDADQATARGTIAAARNDAAQTLVGSQTIQGKVTVDRTGAATAAQVQLSADAGQQTSLDMFTGATTARWKFAKSATAESGADAGSDLLLQGYNDAGSLIATFLTLTRASGLFSYIREMQVGGTSFNFTVDPTNFDFMVENSVGRSYFGGGSGLTIGSAISGTITPRVQVQGTTSANGAMALVTQAAGATARSAIYLAKAGTALAAAGATDDIGSIDFQAYDGATWLRGAGIQAKNTALATGAITTDLVILAASAAAVPTEVARFKANGDLAMGATPTVVIDANRLIRSRSYTIGTLPAASTAAGAVLYCSDLGGGGGLLVSDGSAWRRVSPGQQTVSSNAAFTLTPLTSAEEQKHTGTLTADRAVTLSATNGYAGARFRIKRTGGGAFNLTVAHADGTANIATGGSATFVYDGAAWYLAA